MARAEVSQGPMLRWGERTFQVGWKAVGEFSQGMRAREGRLALPKQSVDESFNTVAASEVRLEFIVNR